MKEKVENILKYSHVFNNELVIPKITLENEDNLNDVDYLIDNNIISFNREEKFLNFKINYYNILDKELFKLKNIKDPLDRYKNIKDEKSILKAIEEDLNKISNDIDDFKRELRCGTFKKADF